MASLAVSRETAFGVFLGTTNLIGGVSVAFLDGIHVTLWIALAILLVAAVLSYLRGNESRERPASADYAKAKPAD